MLRRTGLSVEFVVILILQASTQSLRLNSRLPFITLTIQGAARATGEK